MQNQDREDTIEEETEYEEMAQASAPHVDIAALLAQLTLANIALNQREVDRDARAVVATAVRVREDTIRAQVARIEKCNGDDKPKLRRWIKDITTLNTTHPGDGCRG